MVNISVLIHWRSIFPIVYIIHIMASYTEWIGFKISKQQCSHDKMKYYVQGIQKSQRQLGLTVSSFLDILKETEQPDCTKLDECGGAAVNEL